MFTFEWDDPKAASNLLTHGMSNKARLLVVIHTERQNGIRLISARKATRHEKSIYING